MSRAFQVAWQVILIAGSVLPASAQAESTAGNIFSPPSKQLKQVPEYTNGLRGRGPGNRRGDDIPGWDQIKAIPTLSRQQRTELREMMDKAREELRPLMQQLKALRQQPGSNARQTVLDTPILPYAGPPGQDSGEPLEAMGANNTQTKSARQIRQQLLTRRQEIWQQIKSHLSNEQLQQLELMRKGELLPSNLTQRN